MGGGQSHQSQAFHYWNSPLNQASTPRFFHSITGFAIGRLRWPRTRLHPLPLQRKAAHHPHRQPGARHHHLHRRDGHHLHLERGGHHLLQVSAQLHQVRSGPQVRPRKARQRAHQKAHQKVSQRVRQAARRSASADSESNLDYGRPRYLRTTTDTKTSWVGLLLERYSKIWKLVARKNRKLSPTNVQCAAQ